MEPDAGAIWVMRRLRPPPAAMMSVALTALAGTDSSIRPSLPVKVAATPGRSASEPATMGIGRNLALCTGGGVAAALAAALVDAAEVFGRVTELARAWGSPRLDVPCTVGGLGGAGGAAKAMPKPVGTRPSTPTTSRM